MTTATLRIRAATLAALLALVPAAPALAKGHATAHANAAVQAQQAAKQEAAAWHHQEQAMVHQQQAMVQQQSKAQRSNQALAHRYPARRGSQRSTGNRGYNNRSNAGLNRSNNGQMAGALHSVMAELNRADHDYQGHRVQAIHHLGLAVRSLQPQASNVNLGMNTGTNANANAATKRVTPTGSNGGVAGAPAARMPQAESDAHLQRARQGLMSLQGQMNTGTSTGNRNHQAANTHVQRAMQELNLALNIR